MTIFVVTWYWQEESDVIGATASLREAIGWVKEARAAQDDGFAELSRCEGKEVEMIHVERVYSPEFFERWPNKGNAAVRAECDARTAKAEADLAALEASATS